MCGLPRTAPALLMLLFIACGWLNADIIQTAAVGQVDANNVVLQQDFAKIQQVVILQDILAEIPKRGDTGATAAATAAVGRFGAVGLTAADFSGFASDSGASVDISNDEFLNPTSLTQEVFSNVVIDGGSLRISTGQRIPDSYIEYFYRVDSIFDDIFTDQAFCSSGTLSTDSTGTVVSFNPNTGCFAGDHHVDLHATFDPVSWTVTIPLSFQTFDLGPLPAGQGMTLDYTFSFALHHGAQQGQPSQLFAQFGDPLHLSANSALGSVTMEPLTASSPEPGTLLLLGPALLICLFARGRDRRATEDTTSKAAGACA